MPFAPVRCLAAMTGNSISTIDTGEWVAADFPEGDEVERIPLEADGLTKDRVLAEQLVKFEDYFKLAREEDDSEYAVIDGLLYSVKRPTKFDAIYPRLVLPPCFRKNIILRAHKEVGHMATEKAMHRISDAYVWRGMRSEVAKEIALCGLCAVHTRHREHIPMGDMPMAVYAGQIVSADLTGPLALSNQGNRYILNILDHFSGWVESYCIPDKRNATIVEKFVVDYFPRAGWPEILLTDNGGEFCQFEWEQYLNTHGIDHRHTTPVHPQSNGKVERLNRTLKDILKKLINGDRPRWESELPHALTAYRIAVSAVTGYSPFFMHFARRPRVPLSKMLEIPAAHAEPMHDRLADMSEVMINARLQTEQSRTLNRNRLARKANAGQIVVGDTVIVAANEPVALSAKWDHQFEVTRSEGTTYWIRHQTSGKTLKIHREKLRLVDPNMVWDDVHDRPRRQIRRVRVPLAVPLENENDQPPLPVRLPPLRNQIRPQPPLAPQGQARPPAHARNPLPAPRPDPLPAHAPIRLPAHVPMEGVILAQEAQVPMQIDEPTHPYYLRKRNLQSLGPDPASAKRLRIACVNYTAGWNLMHGSSCYASVPHQS
jgi:hypothetical protein